MKSSLETGHWKTGDTVEKSYKKLYNVTEH